MAAPRDAVGPRHRLSAQSYRQWRAALKDPAPRAVSAVRYRQQRPTAGILTMHSSAGSTLGYDPDSENEEPAVLSYTQFRNHLGLLEWRRRRAQYEQGAAVSAALRQQRPSAPATGR